MDKFFQQKADSAVPREAGSTNGQTKLGIKGDAGSSTTVHRVQTDGIFAYFSSSGMGMREYSAGLILDNGTGYYWSIIARHFTGPTIKVFEVPANVRRELAAVAARESVFGNLKPSPRCPIDAGRSYLFLATHNIGRRLTSCTYGKEREWTNPGMETVLTKLDQLAHEPGEHIEFNVLVQQVRAYLGSRPGGDPRRIQVQSWLGKVTAAGRDAE